MSDNRTTLTDAVATLGTIIGEDQKRDAIHLATEPVVAGERLRAGEHIYLRDNKAWLAYSSDRPVGIVDPFLEGIVPEGARFWLIVYPRRITSLRHTWEHPDFPSIDTTVAVEQAVEPSTLTCAIQYVKGRAENWDTTYECIMSNAHDSEGEDEIFTSNGYMETDEDFWGAYNTITGREVTPRAFIDDGCRGC